MPIVAFVDIYGAYRKVEKVLANQAGADLVLLVGDITTNGTEKEVSDILQAFKDFGKPVLGIDVYMDSPAINNVLIRAECSIDGRGKQIGDVGLFGVSVGPSGSLHTPYEISEEEILQKAKDGWQEVKDLRWKIFVPHAPPFQTSLDKIFLGRHVGSTAIPLFIESHQPDAVIWGHIHESRGKNVLGQTKMINCGAASNGYYGKINIGTEITLENCE
jgi:uncharacterized protein